MSSEELAYFLLDSGSHFIPAILLFTLTASKQGASTQA